MSVTFDVSHSLMSPYLALAAASFEFHDETADLNPDDVKEADARAEAYTSAMAGLVSICTRAKERPTSFCSIRSVYVKSTGDV
jgi:hypothetical protein